jgi:hypothetical protein
MILDAARLSVLSLLCDDLPSRNGGSDHAYR